MCHLSFWDDCLHWPAKEHQKLLAANVKETEKDLEKYICYELGKNKGN